MPCGTLHPLGLLPASWAAAGYLLLPLLLLLYLADSRLPSDTAFLACTTEAMAQVGEGEEGEEAQAELTHCVTMWWQGRDLPQVCRPLCLDGRLACQLPRLVRNLLVLHHVSTR